MPKNGWIEVFKEGEHTSSNGVKKTYTGEDLDHIAKTYNDQTEHNAPFVLGHPKTDDPAYGWVKELKHVGHKLMAFMDSVSDDVADAVARGEYKHVSIALYPNLLLRHVGLLGATPPAVKGLAPVTFAEGEEFDEYVWVTDEWRVPIIGRLLRGIRDFVIEKFGLETADSVLPNYDLDTLTDRIPSTLLTIPTQPDPIVPQESISVPPLGAITSTYSETNNKEDEMEKAEIQAMIDEALKGPIDQIAALAGQFAEAAKSIQELSTSLQTSTASAQATAEEKAKLLFSETIDALIKEGKVLPAEKDMLVEEYADMLKVEQGMEFAEGIDSYSVKMVNRLKNRPVLVTKRATFAKPDAVDGDRTKLEVPTEFSEIANKVDPASVDLDTAIKAYAEEHKLSYEEAAAKYSAA